MPGTTVIVSGWSNGVGWHYRTAGLSNHAVLFVFSCGAAVLPGTMTTTWICGTRTLVCGEVETLTFSRR